MRTLIPTLLVLLAAAPAAASGVYSWVDAEGVTHFADDASAAPAQARQLGPDRLRGLFGEALVGEPTGGPASPASSLEEERQHRLLRGAEDDLARGETARAEAVLTEVLRDDPAQPDAHWLLARVARQRGHYDTAEVHLRAFLAAAGDDDDARRLAAERRLRDLADERRLADPGASDGEARWVRVQHPHFRVRYDAALGSASDDYADTVLGFLDAAYDDVGTRLGSVPKEPLGVMLYGKANYLRAYRHRFSFRTVGFFDGRIHVVSAAHPAGELRALLFHEYTHAVFRERTGDDRPYWLNEGMAELAERASRDEPALARTERSWLRRRIDAGSWIPLRQLAPSFAGLDDEDARAAYLQATAAAAWIERRTTREQRGHLLELLGQGRSDDEALHAVLGCDTEGLDRTVREWIRSEFAPAGLEL